MECVNFQSRLLVSAAYYSASNRLCVWFTSGRCAWHDGVSEAMFRNLVKAESPGFYYSNYIADREDAIHLRPPGRTWKIAASFAVAAVVLGVQGFSASSASKHAPMTISSR